MSANGGLAVEELGRRSDWHPGWCHRRHSEGQPHESVRFHVAGRQVWASADCGWQVDVHRTGSGRLGGDDARYLAAIVQYLSEPARTGR